MKSRLWLLGLVFSFPLLADIRVIDSRYRPSCGQVVISPYMLDLHVVEVLPEAGRPILGDVFFSNGFADEANNHLEYFKELARAGYRVISFDYPSHGFTRGPWLNWYKMDDLLEVARELIWLHTEEFDRPLILAGWSTGGLLATRLLQLFTKGELGRKPKAAILVTPGMREIQFSDHDDGISAVFEDIESIAGQCRFSDCQHRTEPNCAILEALASGELTAERFSSYQKLQREQEFQRRKTDKAFASATRDQWKKVHKQARLREKLRRR